MRTIFYTNQFKRDFKRIQKQNKNLAALRSVIEKLSAGENLEERYRDHALQGEYAGIRDCHISPDWLLLYTVNDEQLRLIRTGTHAELFE